MAAESEKPGFDLFISYATDPDYALSRNLESFLESFHRLPNPGGVALRPLRVCVDGSDFHSQNEVGVTLEDYLARCDSLLVLGSANARSSRWVNDEVLWFLEHRRDRIRVAHTEGVDPMHAENVLPPPLVEAGFHRHIAYDFRGAKRGAKERLRAVRDFEDERTRLAADLYGQPAGEISPIWFREQHRRSRNQLRAVSGAALVLLLLLGVAIYFFLRARAEARRAWRQSYIASTNLALRAWGDGAIDLAKQTLDAQVPRHGEEDLRDFEWSHVHRRVDAQAQSLFIDKVAVEAVDVSRDGTLVAAGGRLWGEAPEESSPAHRVYVWSLRDGKQVAALVGHEEDVSAVAFSPNAPILASGGQDAVRIWDLTAKQQIHSFEPGFNKALAFSPDGSTLAFLEGDRLVLADTRNWKERASTFVPDSTTFAFSPDGKQIAVAADDAVHVLDTKSLKRVRMEAIKLASALAWSPHNMLAIGHGRAVTLLDGASGTKLPLESEFPVASLAFSRDGAILAVGAGDRQEFYSGRTIELFDVEQGCARGVLRGHRGRVFSMATTPDGRLVSAGEEEAIRVWDLETASYLHGVALPTTSNAPMWSIAFTPDGSRLLAGDAFGYLYSASIRGTRSVTTTAVPHGRFDMDVSPDGLLATAGDDGTVFLRPAGAPPRLLFQNAKSPQMTAVRFSPDGHRLAVANCDGTIRFWSGPAFTSLTTRKQVGCPTFLTWSPDSRFLVSGGGDPANEKSPRFVVVWNPDDENPILPAVGHRSWPRAGAFSPDGRLLVTGDWSGELIVYDARSWKEKLRMRGQDDSIVGLSFTPSGKSIVSAGNGGTVHFWDPVTGQERAVLGDAGKNLYAFAMSPAGDIVAAATEDARVIFWLTEGTSLTRSRGAVQQTNRGSAE